MEIGIPSRLAGSEIHGFSTMADLDFGDIMKEAKTRWLRPNEIHAILCNYKYFSIHVKPVNLPKSGTIVLFDRKKLRNFRKDGHNWKKKKDGRTVKEAHEHLKVGNDERIHVYYAHGEDNLTFVRRCYWLLDKSLEHIVLVHYRETQEGSPATPVNSNSPAVSDPSAPWPSEESDSAVNRAYSTRPESVNNDSVTIKNHEQRLHEINTLEWDELLVPFDPNKSIIPEEGKTSSFALQNQYQTSSFKTKNTVPGLRSLGGRDSLDNLSQDASQMQDSFGRWINYIIADSPGSVDDQTLESSISDGYQPFNPPMNDNHGSSVSGQIFNITDVSPVWGLSNEETKVVVVGVFHGGQLPIPESNVFVVCGDSMVPTVAVQSGVFRCSILPQSPGSVNLYLSFDGHTPISQVFSFEFRAPKVNITPPENNSDWEKIRFQTRLAHLLFSSSKSLNIFSSKVSRNALKEAKDFSQKTSLISDSWKYLMESIKDIKMSFPQAKDSLFELTLQNRLLEWLIENVLAGSKISERDEQGQGVIHLCAILGYTWAVYPFSWSGLSLDYRDKFGWTALHWAAYYGRENMVATLLSAGAKPSLVTDSTSQNPGGCTAADLASINGHDGLAAYLAEKGLVAHFKDMALAGNASGSLQTTTNDSVNYENFTEELYLKDTLAAYRTAADAAARIHAAFREHSFKLRTKEVQSSNPEIDARNIVAAMKIQHAFRNFDTRKKIKAAAQIQYRFRTWKMRKDFLNMRRQATRIQAVFRGFQVRRQYHKIVWSVGIVEKAILRWRLKRKGFRGLQVQADADLVDKNQESVAEEDFFKASRKQAEERVERSVVRVQAMFRSKQAQEEYRRIKLAHNEAKVITFLLYS
ncbi:calmodulin-binding transcription activator 5 isoform X1 [Olea europaea subsp. europaea]|uniref:Calmodulin-binding transcription activator 5 isoform X1 n=1 Tax=Olea europaea subsp. europaea TaxID=158383 RepID=A0A8S0SBF9_OLEEU|nr:calmodulin-binding transcription activator 5 isoform X1 [Olea europaea subsp. europaea]